MASGGINVKFSQKSFMDLSCAPLEIFLYIHVVPLFSGATKQ